MNQRQTKLYAKIESLAVYSEDAYRAQILLSEKHARDTFFVKEAAKLWGRKPHLLARMAKWFAKELERAQTYWELMSMYEMVRLPKQDCAILAKDWRDKSLSYQQVKGAVDAKKQRKPRERKAKRVDELKQLGDQLSAVVKHHHLPPKKHANHGDLFHIGCEVCEALKRWEGIQ